MAETRRCAAVTGAGSGIGAATARLLARDGYRVACLDRDEAAARRIVDELGGAAAGHLMQAVDVADEAAVSRVFTDIAAAFGRLDGLATCAGIADTTPFLDLSAETFRRVYDVNVVGTFLCIREAALRMTRGGRICTISSVAGLRGGGVLGTAAYAASKGAVLALTKNAARSLAERGIAVNAVAPGATLTPMTDAGMKNDAQRARILAMVPIGRAGDPEEIAEAIVWLLSPKSTYVDGATLTADGGMVMP
jgi:NAD(P)-dependent dehydrogenase (short-subunit alcohol dehydrogenase family)